MKLWMWINAMWSLPTTRTIPNSIGVKLDFSKSIKSISEVCNLFCQESKKYLDFYSFSSGFVDLGTVPFCRTYSSFFPYQEWKSRLNGDASDRVWIAGTPLISSLQINIYPYFLDSFTPLFFLFLFTFPFLCPLSQSLAPLRSSLILFVPPIP